MTLLDYSFNPLAEHELDAALETSERDFGSSTALREAVESAILQLRQFPESAPIARGRVRAKVLSHYPFTLFYSISSNGLRILAFGHQAQQPFAWLGRR